ncbi:hypothetical protein CIB95_08125 [Lottiidibacillus patelloidae]|uniref:Uncharacterized protein n=1 Tax=Lottiidibacillus patelloidae TaxID=2670334 RepID=A0A263BVR2_9BACI|nr:hypothetical protein [Lottiidibacillus patelloidae]OZM57417.1 hypothetical protein CIB95_08125 [Lottiidibacillus patelloidae]
MDKTELEKKIIEQYKADEGMMILVFVQWCINNQLDPISLYEKAYPDQKRNPLLTQMMENSVSKEEAGDIADETLLQVLSLFGNDDLAFVVSEEITNRDKDNR